MKRALAISLVGLTGCSILFDPDKVKKDTCEALPDTPLDIIAGDGTSLTFEWPSPAERPDLKEYKLCWSGRDADAGTCATVPYRTCSDGGPCAFTVDGRDAEVFGGFVEQRDQRLEVART